MASSVVDAANTVRYRSKIATHHNANLVVSAKTEKLMDGSVGFAKVTAAGQLLDSELLTLYSKPASLSGKNHETPRDQWPKGL